MAPILAGLLLPVSGPPMLARPPTGSAGVSGGLLEQEPRSREPRGLAPRCHQTKQGAPAWAPWVVAGPAGAEVPSAAGLHLLGEEGRLHLSEEGEAEAAAAAQEAPEDGGPLAAAAVREEDPQGVGHSLAVAAAQVAAAAAPLSAAQAWEDEAPPLVDQA